MHNQAAATLTIGRLSKATGVKIETIRYYERIGLLAAPARTEGGHRLYSETQTNQLGFIRRGRELGFSLEIIANLLKLAEQDGPCGEVQELASAHLLDVEQRIADLQLLRNSLRETVRHCEGGQAVKCAVLEALFSTPSLNPPMPLARCYND